MNRKPIDLEDAIGKKITAVITRGSDTILLAIGADEFVIVKAVAEDDDAWIDADCALYFNRAWFRMDELKKVFDEATIAEWAAEDAASGKSQAARDDAAARKLYETLKAQFGE